MNEAAFGEDLVALVEFISRGIWTIYIATKLFHHEKGTVLDVHHPRGRIQEFRSGEPDCC
jgi:hypothetical protein